MGAAQGGLYNGAHDEPGVFEIRGVRTGRGNRLQGLAGENVGEKLIYVSHSIPRVIVDCIRSWDFASFGPRARGY